jgi:hypothetical protein
LRLLLLTHLVETLHASSSCCQTAKGPARFRPGFRQNLQIALSYTRRVTKSTEFTSNFEEFQIVWIFCSDAIIGACSKAGSIEITIA